MAGGATERVDAVLVGAERTERMRRLAMAARITTVTRCAFTYEGPETAPAEAFTHDAVTRTVAI
jgi:hypothetical protein